MVNLVVSGITIVKSITVSTPQYTPLRTTDVETQITNVSDNQFLRYDSAVGKWTNQSFDSAFDVELDNSGLGGRGLTYDSSSDTLNIDSSEFAAYFSTTNLPEGTNLYYTRARFDSALGDITSISTIRGYFNAGGDLTYDSSTGKFSIDAEQVYTKANFDSDFNVALDSATLGGKGLAYNSTTNTLSIDSAELYAQYKHDGFSDYVGNEHIDHTGVTLTAGKGLSGGGDISASRSFAIDSSEFLAGYEASINHDNLAGFVADEHVAHTSVNLSVGRGLTGGGDITTSRSFAIDSAELYAKWDHDGFNDYVANEHINHTAVTLTAGKGLSGGGDISASRSFAIDSAEFLAGYEASINHDNLTGFVGNEHINHTSVTLTAGKGLSGGGDISASRSFAIDSSELYAKWNHDGFNDYVANEHINHTSVTLTAGKGLSGGGDISSNRSFAIDSAEFLAGFEASINHDNLTGFVADEHVAHTSVTLTAGRGLSGGGDISASRSFAIDSAEFAAYFTTANLPEGSNLYYTSVRVDSDARNAVSATDAGGDGSFTYNPANGTFTYTGPSASEVRSHLVAGTGVTYDSASGVIAIGQPVAPTDSVTFSGMSISGNLVVNGTQTIVNTKTTVVSDPLLHLADSNVHDVVDIGFIGHYSTDAGVTLKHTGLFRDASNGEYYLFSGLVQDDLDSNNVVSVGGTGWTIATLNANVVGTYSGFDSDFATKTTDNLSEGSTNLYYTTARADSDAKNAISGGTGITYTVATGVIATNDAQIDHDALNNFVANEHIDHTSVTLTAGKGLSGGGDISSSRSFAIDSAEFLAGYEASINHDNLTGFVADEHVAHSGVNLSVGRGLTGGGDITTSRSFAIDSSELYAKWDHDGFNDYVANEHIDHTSVTLTAGKGLSGGGDISASRSFAIDSAEFLAGFEASINHDNLTGFVADEHVAHTSVTLTAGKGLSGGGDISSSRAFAIDSAEFAAYFSTTNLPEGTNLYYTRSRFDSDLGDPTSRQTIRGYLNVGGDLSYDSATGKISYTDNVPDSASLTTIAQTSISTFPAATYSGGKFVINATDKTNDYRHITELLVTHNGTTASGTQYGTVTTDSDLATFDVDLTGGNVRILATGSTANHTVYKITKNLISL